MQGLNIFVADLLISMNIALASACFFAVASTRELRAARCSRYLLRAVGGQSLMQVLRVAGTHSIFASFIFASRKLTCTCTYHKYWREKHSTPQEMVFCTWLAESIFIERRIA